MRNIAPMLFAVTAILLAGNDSPLAQWALCLAIASLVWYALEAAYWNREFTAQLLLSLLSMTPITTYVLSEHATSWLLYRCSDYVTQAATEIDTKSEKEALDIAVRKASEDRPSQILKIALSGETKVVATFKSVNPA